MSLGSPADAIAGQPTARPSPPSARMPCSPAVSEQCGGPHTALEMMLERADPEMFDFVRRRAGRFRERTVEPPAEHTTKQRETSGSDGPATTSRAGAADRPTLFEIEGNEL